MSFFRSRYLLISVALVAAIAFASFDTRLGVLAVVIVAFVALLPLFSSRSRRSGRSRELELYQKLLKRARGNAELVERLIEHERKRTPDVGNATLLESALVRWEQDNR